VCERPEGSHFGSPDLARRLWGVLAEDGRVRWELTADPTAKRAWWYARRTVDLIDGKQVLPLRSSDAGVPHPPSPLLAPTGEWGKGSPRPWCWQ
jgi:hypothetical protein